MLTRHLPVAVLILGICWAGGALAQTPLAPFQPDGHTLLLYHFDEGQGAAAHDASRCKYDGEVRGAQWAKGKFGTALRFDGKDDCVFRKTTETIAGLKQITIECWFMQDNTEGRQFLMGKDATFHFDINDGAWTSISIYNKGGREKNAEGLAHRQIGATLGLVLPDKWHHNAITYDGEHVSFFFDGVLKQRMVAPKDFSLGLETLAFWVGCYIGRDYWYSGAIDEVRVSDCVRYDPEKKLSAGARVFEVPKNARSIKAVRKANKTGMAKLCITLRKLYGKDAAGWLYVKPPGKRAAIVGNYELKGMEDKAERKFEADVSDEVTGDGGYVLGLEATDIGAYFEVTSATLTRGDKQIAQWAGHARSRRTFKPPVLVPLQAGARTMAKPSRILLLPQDVDRLDGEMEVDDGERTASPRLVGMGGAEYWLNIPERSAYRVYMRYATASARPCDVVIDGNDLNDYDMCAVNRTGSRRQQDALWEYQGTAVLEPGLHWFRVEGIPPDIFAIRLDPAAPIERARTPWERYPVPDGTSLEDAARWRDGVRLVRSGTFDLEPFGRLRFRFERQGSGHVVALWLVDVKGDEKLLWRVRDMEAVPQEVAVPISFEGNDVFDPAHVAAICLDLDEGNVNADRLNRFAGAIVNPVFERRDELVQPDTAAPPVKPPKAGERSVLLARQHKPWTKPIVPEDHPLYAATNPKPVTRKTMGYALHFTGARGTSEKTLDDFHKYYDFGNVCWPHIGICPQRKLLKTESDYKKALSEMEERVKDVRARGLYLFDIWGYVPFAPEFPSTIAPEHDEILKRVLGDRFLGYDNGEQDGRYIGAYARQGKAANRKEGWDDFVKWDELVCGDSMNYMNAIGSLNFSHYYAERGARTLGLETAQGLPSDTMMFGFLRGAAKQYGRLMTQATSVWNRFGYNIYTGRKTERPGGYGYGPNKGCSRSLHKRLFFCSYLEGHSIFGTETGQFTADRLENDAPELSALGRQHLDLKAWSEKHPDRGVMYTPVAFMLDFYNGWNPPRHLYRQDRYMIWGKFPYEKGDYLTDAMFRMVWPGYEDASYLRNERGFVCPTPYGDLFDVLTNRCHPEIMRQYAAIMLLGDVEMTPEVVKKLADYVAQGGDLIADARHAKSLPENLTGVKIGENAKATMSIVAATGQVFSEQLYTYAVVTPVGATHASPLRNEFGHPLIAVNPVGKGRVIVGATDYWMTDALTYRYPELVNMEPPYMLLRGVQTVLGQYFDSFSPVEISPKGLTIKTCFFDNDPKRMLVGLMNNDLFADWAGTLHIRKGGVASARELWKERTLPAAQEMPLKIEAGDVAVVEVRLR